MAEIRVIFGDDDRENEEFLGFDLALKLMHDFF
jgi:hypothetical protein